MVMTMAAFGMEEEEEEEREGRRMCEALHADHVPRAAVWVLPIPLKILEIHTLLFKRFLR